MLDLKKMSSGAVGAIPAPEDGRVVVYVASDGSLRAKASDGGVTLLADGSISRKVVTVPVTAVGANVAPHGVDLSKVVGFTCVSFKAGALSVQSDYGSNADYRFSAYLDASACVVYLLSNEGANVKGGVVKFIVWTLA